MLTVSYSTSLLYLPNRYLCVLFCILNKIIHLRWFRYIRYLGHLGMSCIFSDDLVSDLKFCFVKNYCKMGNEQNIFECIQHQYENNDLLIHLVVFRIHRKISIHSSYTYHDYISLIKINTTTNCHWMGHYSHLSVLINI